jgi:penicillin-binding protein 1A
MSDQKKPKLNGIYKKVVIGLWVITLSIIVFLPLFIYSVNINFLNLYGGMPSLRSLENPKNELASELWSADGQLLGKYFRENRTPVEYEDLSPNLINALIATEDYRFEKHSGIDLRGMGRVLVKSLLMGNSSTGGGSTLSQQLAKILFNTRGKNFEGHLSEVPGIRMLIIKVKEWIVAVKLEQAYTKKEILTMYLNTADYSSNSFGIHVAAKTYFDKEPRELNIQESAMLVGMLQAPSKFNPVRNPNNANHRRNVVLGQMVKYNFLPSNQFDSIKNLPIELKYKVENHNEGIATYFRSEIQKTLLKWANEHGYDLYESGLKIYTTIDSRLQKIAEEALISNMSKLQKTFDEHWKGKNPWIDERYKEIPNFIETVSKRSEYYRLLERKYGKGNDSIEVLMNQPRKMRVFSWEGEIDTLLSPYDSVRYYKRFLQSGFMAMNPRNGHIKVWVGGISHKFFKYDHVKQGKRQPGSTFKPIVYATVIESGYSPCYEVADVPRTYQTHSDPPTWTPQNADGNFTGAKMTIRQALAKSINSVTAQLIMEKTTPANVVNMAKRLGIESKLEAVPSLCLGAGGDISLYEMVGAYSTFANEGTWTEPFFISRIEDKNGNIIQEFVPKNIEALNEETAYLMLHMLRGATEEAGGTALGLRGRHPTLFGDENQIGAKTGTTQNGSDGWFIGVTKDLVGGVWVGGDDRSIRFRNWVMGSGSRTAMPIWANFMEKVYADPNLGYKKAPFDRPEKISVEINCDRYKNLEIDNEEDENGNIKLNQNDIR